MAPAPPQAPLLKIDETSRKRGVSINSLVTAIIADVIGARQASVITTQRCNRWRYRS
jgi:hypothetical protein